MQYIIFGAGQTGKNAMAFLDYWRVACFAANSPCEPIDNKKVVSYSEMLDMVEHGDYVIVVASARYNAEMVAQLKSDGVKKFFVFHDAAPSEIWTVYPAYRLHRQTVFVPYVKAVSMLGIEKYKRIAIYGDNFFLPYLISEIAFQNDFKNIVGIVKTTGNNSISTLGLPTVSLDEVWNDIDCLVINERRCNIKNLEALEDRFRTFDFMDIYDIEPHIPEFYHPELAKYKDIHKGKRCFVIGNGPSLRIEDLDKLYAHGEICFGFNKIYRVYDKTKWRADYLGFSDDTIMEDCKEEISELSKRYTILLTDAFQRTFGTFFENGIYAHEIMESYYPNMPRFSMDVRFGTFWGGTSVYEVGLQWAVYMGFAKIYLLGVDCFYQGKTVGDKKNYFLDNYCEEWEKGMFKLEISDMVVPMMKTSFESAELYSRRHGFRIFNATRGGKLEAFERVDFDSLFD